MCPLGCHPSRARSRLTTRACRSIDEKCQLTINHETELSLVPRRRVSPSEARPRLPTKTVKQCKSHKSNRDSINCVPRMGITPARGEGRGPYILTPAKSSAGLIAWRLSLSGTSVGLPVGLSMYAPQSSANCFLPASFSRSVMLRSSAGLRTSSRL